MSDIQKCIDDIKDIVLVLTDPKEWERQRDLKIRKEGENEHRTEDH